MGVPNDISAGERNKNTTIFLHIPKSAGQTLFQILDREYKRSNIYTFQGGRRRLAASIEEFKQLPSAERNRYHLLRGHVSFGVHHLVEQPFTYVTILRDPIARIVSHYNYVLRTPAHALHDLATSSGMDIARYVSSGISTELNNGQVRMIAGVGSSVPFGECNESHFAKAISNLETHFSVVGLTDRFDETILLMHQNLYWRKLPYYTKRNVTKQRTDVMRLTAVTINLIRQYNALDCRLYDYAVQKFEEAVIRLPLGLQQRFQRLNSAYYPYGRTMFKVNSWLRVLYKSYRGKM
ncbi:MAG: sulfotransferase family 2 domain-containing protein [Anaerolineales bacterium]|nr:sulfotransferase family 2 domain-containing protein [Anaerolineales bacterium]